jgi:hypothetical protein
MCFLIDGSMKVEIARTAASRPMATVGVYMDDDVVTAASCCCNSVWWLRCRGGFVRPTCLIDFTPAGQPGPAVLFRRDF